MRKTALAALILLLCTVLNGCAVFEQPENQAYAVSLALDRAENGELTLSVCTPNVAEGGEGGVSGTLAYPVFSATAPDLPQALDLLQATVPRPLELSQLKSIVLSQKLAQESGCKELIDQLMLTYRLHSAAYFIVTLGEARNVIENQKALIGTRLSVNVTTSLEHYHAKGYIPSAHLADVYYGFNSFYSDPIAILSATADDQHFRAMQNGRMGDALPGTLPRSGDNQNEYMGCALFDNQHMVGVLTGLECIWLEVLRGQVKQVAYVCQDESIQLAVERSPRISIDISGEHPSIDIVLELTSASLIQQPNPDILGKLVQTDILSVIAKCQSLGVEPFDFAPRVAAQFPTTQAFEDYGWKQRFPEAPVNLTVKISDS